MKKVVFVLAIVMIYGLSISTASEKVITDEKGKVVITAQADENKAEKPATVKDETPKAAKSEGCAEAKAEAKGEGCATAKAKSEGCGEAKTGAKAEGCAEKAKSASACKDK